ncbi:hypothetical protein KCU92_g9503, partial [Aureobasidium melanogenum]
MPRQQNDRLPYRGKQNVSFMISRTLHPPPMHSFPICASFHLDVIHHLDCIEGQFDALFRHRRGRGFSRGYYHGVGFQDRGRDGSGRGREGFQLPVHSGPFGKGIFPEGNVLQPNQEVLASEDPRVRDTIERLSRHSSHDVKGLSIELRANHLHLAQLVKSHLPKVNLTGNLIFVDRHIATDFPSHDVKSEKLGLGLADHKQSKIGFIDPALPASQGPANVQAYDSQDSS